jgi:hypothetical protein
MFKLEPRLALVRGESSRTLTGFATASTASPPIARNCMAASHASLPTLSYLEKNDRAHVSAPRCTATKPTIFGREKIQEDKVSEDNSARDLSKM